jgi:hypothetical protein
VHLACDGAAYGPDGTLTAITTKAFALPHLGCAVAFRGDMRGVALVTDLAMAPSYGALRNAAVAMVGEAIAEIGAPIEPYVGGFSDAGTPDAYAVTVQAVGGSDGAGVVMPIRFCDPEAHGQRC